jgi:hypothetical protein
MSKTSQGKQRRNEQMLHAEAAFYAWKPPGDQESSFRCRHTSQKHTMREEICMARARKPEMYQDKCGGGRPRCPRWKHYRKLARKEAVVRRPYP